MGWLGASTLEFRTNMNTGPKSGCGGSVYLSEAISFCSFTPPTELASHTTQ